MAHTHKHTHACAGSGERALAKEATVLERIFMAKQNKNGMGPSRTCTSASQHKKDITIRLVLDRARSMRAHSVARFECDCEGSRLFVALFPTELIALTYDHSRSLIAESDC